ncbi:voltage-dependent anion-selective channel-like [Sycon ciliatum]|uniref:voltage-dependent anion-selective channel-like n=1 Tax=Sycon ciliatum TaxID=27933 RepID=UPI0031F5FD85
MAECGMPSYASLGDAANKVLADGVDYDRAKVDFKYTGCDKNFSVHSGCAIATDSTLASHCIQVSHPAVEIGDGKSFSYSHGYNSDENAMMRKFCFETGGVRGMRLKADLSTHELFKIDRFRLLGSAQHTKFHGTAGVDVEVDRQCSGVSGSTSFRLGPCLAGCQFSYDLPSRSFPDRQIGVSYSEKDFTASGSLHTGTDFRGYRMSLHQRVSERLQCAAQVVWAAGSSSASFALGAEGTLDDESSLKVKFNNQSDLGVTYKRRLEPGVTLSAGVLFGLQSLSLPSIQHFGVGLTFEAEGTPPFLLSLLKGRL